MKKNIMIALLLIFVLVVSCTRQPEDARETAENGSEDIPEDADVMEETKELTTGECQPRWGCISSSTKAYQQEDCSWVERKNCPLGCFNGTCRQGNTCDSGFKCKDDNTKGYQTEVCRWTNEKECEWGCLNGECNLQPDNNTINQTAAEEQELEEEKTIPQKNIKLLDAGDKHTLAYDGEDHGLSVYLIEKSRVKLLVDQQKSDWLEEKAVFTHSSGLKIKVESILFQSYPGGKKAVEYTVG